MPESRGPRRLDSEPCAHADLSSQLDEEAQLCKGEPDCASLAPPQSQPCQAQASVRLRGVWAREGREGRQH